MLSLVDNRSFRRLSHRVLDHTPTQADIVAFFQRAKRELDRRGLQVCGITTDGSSLYPAAIEAVFGAVPHQICQFHILQDISRAVLHALASERKTIQAQLPKLPRGRPSGAQRAITRKVKRQQDRIADLFTHRYLFVQRTLSDAERRTFLRITRHFPHLRVLRDIMEQVYALFDRRCRVATALAKLARLRRRILRFKRLRRSLQTLCGANVEKALTFLDDKLLPATSNAVERANRRFRKMQGSVYSVRTLGSLEARLALDMLRDRHAPTRARSTSALHRYRANVRSSHGAPCFPVDLL